VARGVTAQGPSDVHQHTTSPSDARFEILQSQLAAKWTFRLDRFTGRIAQLVRTIDDDNAWQEMEVEQLPAISTPSRPRFQLFTSGLAARHTFLIDTLSGQSWTVVTGKRKAEDGSEHEVSRWVPFAK
jgi:hypothetical protein